MTPEDILKQEERSARDSNYKRNYRVELARLRAFPPVSKEELRKLESEALAKANIFGAAARDWRSRISKEPTQRPLSVRIARPSEEERLFKTLMLLGEENAMAEISKPKVRAMLQRCRSPEPGQPRYGVIGVIDAPKGGIAATVGLVTGQWWYTEEWHCEEVWSFVHPDHRRDKANHAKDLIQFSKWWGEQLGWPVLMGVLSNVRTLGKIRLYAREIPLVGALFLHRAA